MNENMNAAKQGHTIAQAFVFLLLGIFAVLCTLMVLLGAQLYRGSVARTEETASARVLNSYVINVVRANDASGLVRCEQRSGTDVLVFDWDADGASYETLVYCHDGYLRELFTEAGQQFNPAFGDEICPAQSFRAQMQDGLLRVELSDEHGQDSVLHLALRSSQEADHA